MTKSIIEDRPDIADGEGGGEDRHVVDLLVEQVESADLIVLNKADRLKEDQLERLESTIESLNETARVIRAEYGAVELKKLFSCHGTNKGPGEAELEDVKADECCKDESHGHGAGHGAEHGAGHGTGHEGGHGHGHGAENAGSSGHGEGHGNAHGHGHGHGAGAEVVDPVKKKFNISNFTYSRRRPFNPTRLQIFLQGLPADVGRCVVPVSESKDVEKVDALKKILHCVIRSKGFCWLTSEPRTALYWQHAGAFFELQAEGAWWADVDEGQMPEGPTKAKIMKDFADPYGDRRQEIVFIGIGMKNAEIESQLDECLLTDEELVAYNASTGQGSNKKQKA